MINGYEIFGFDDFIITRFEEKYSDTHSEY